MMGLSSWILLCQEYPFHGYKLSCIDVYVLHLVQSRIKMHRTKATSYIKQDLINILLLVLQVVKLVHFCGIIVMNLLALHFDVKPKMQSEQSKP